jgi:hypothetical protein
MHLQQAFHADEILIRFKRTLSTRYEPDRTRDDTLHTQKPASSLRDLYAGLQSDRSEDGSRGDFIAGISALCFFFDTDND